MAIGRNTVQRELVMDMVSHMCHPTAEEIYSKIACKYPTISRGTVYRNLGVLVEQGKLRKVPMTEAADCYDITTGKHYHIRCRMCGRVEDISLPYQEELLASIPNTGGFLVEEHDILLKGLCPTCRDKATTIA